jgi:hypothetical protein
VADEGKDLIISDLSGGRNGIDSPISPDFPFDQCVEAMNVDFRNGGLGRKRGGSKDVLSNTTAHGFTQPVVCLDRHTPGAETAGEVWGWESVIPGNIARLPPGTAWTPVAAFATTYSSVADIAKTVNVSFNGKMFSFFLGTGSDRLKVFDSGTNTIRYVGLSPGTNAPTAANQGAGAYAATIRYYRVRWVDFQSSKHIRVSEPTPSVSFTPSGAGASARVTRPANPGEGENYWYLEYSPDNINFYKGYLTAIATTFVDDTVLVANEPAAELSELTGTYTLVPSAKVGCTDGNRLIFANWDVTGAGSRVGWTPVLGSLDRGDDERMFQTATIRPYIDLDTKNGGDITAIAVIHGIVYVFKFRQVWRLTPTEDLSRPYVARKISSTVGAVSQRCLSVAEDASGNACINFMSHKGPYRVSASGLEYIGRDIEDLTRTSAGKPNINTVATGVISHSVFHNDLGQWWVWFATGSNNNPNECCIFDVKRATRRDVYGVRGGWSRVSGTPATAICSCMGPYEFGNTGNLRPWVGLPGNTNIWILDRDDVQTDNGTNFQAYVKTRSVSGFGKKLKVGESTLVASHASAVDVAIRQTIITDFGVVSDRTADVTLLAADTGLTLIKKFDDSKCADAKSIQLQLGDSAAAATKWEMRLLYVPVWAEGDI